MNPEKGTILLSPVCKPPSLPIIPISLVSFHSAFQKLLSLCFRWQVHDQMNTDSLDVSAWRRLIRRLTGSKNTHKCTFSCPPHAPSISSILCHKQYIISLYAKCMYLLYQRGNKAEKSQVYADFLLNAGNRRWPVINMNAVPLCSSRFMDLDSWGWCWM